MSRFKFWFIGLATIIAIVAGFRLVRKPAVAVTQLRTGPAVKAIYATGTVETRVMLPLAPRMSARLIALQVDEGAVVAKGQLLAQLEDNDMQNVLKELKVREEYAKSEYERNLIASQRGAISPQILTKAKSDWEMAKAAAAKGEAENEYLKITAPDSGMIVRRDGEIGELIPVNQPIFWFINNEPLRISAEVDEEDIADVKVDQKVLIQADAFPAKVFNGKVTAITPKGDPIARSYRVRIEFTEPVPFKIGMTAETNIIVSENPEALLLPAASVVNNSYVWKIVDERLRQQKVLIGAKSEDKVEILEGLSVRDVVALAPGADFKEGQKIRIQ